MNRVYNSAVEIEVKPRRADQGTRRQPVQARSMARVDRILKAATTLVERDGVDAATTRAIAAEAGVPVATLYQFFEDREAVLAAVLQRELAALDAHVAAASSVTTDLATFVDFGIEVHREYYKSHPAFARLWFGGRVAPAVESAVRGRGRHLAQRWHRVLKDAGLIAPSTDLVVAELAVELGDRVFECAYRRRPREHDAIFAEGKRALTAYLAQYA